MGLSDDGGGDRVSGAKDLLFPTPIPCALGPHFSPLSALHHPRPYC